MRSLTTNRTFLRKLSLFCLLALLLHLSTLCFVAAVTVSNYLSQIKAAIRTFNPKEEKYLSPEPKFRVAVTNSRVFCFVHCLYNAVCVKVCHVIVFRTCRFNSKRLKLGSVNTTPISLVVVWSPIWSRTSPTSPAS